jgi:uncharacterized MAPEG superfamily protein
MNIPVLVLLAFAMWTLLVLAAGVGVYRWSRILTGRASVADWWAGTAKGSDWYQRATRAHMNCVENLPVYGAVVVGLSVAGLQSHLIDWLSVSILVARIGQTTVHLSLPATNAVASLRFALYFVQMLCMTAMGIAAAAALVS